MVLGAFVTYVSRSSCAAQPRTSRPFLRAGADFGGVSSSFAVLCGCGGTGPRARAHVRVLSLYSQLLLLPHSNSSNTSRGRPGARHPPLRGDSATPGRLPAALRRRLDHDGQARSTRPERALLPGFFGLGQPTWAGGAAGHICRGCSEDAGPWARSIGPWASIVQSHVHRTATSLPSPADWPEGHQIEPTTRPGGNGEHLRASPGPRPARSRLSPDDESGAAAPVVDERGHSTRPRLVRGGSSAAQCSRSGARGPDGREGAARRSRALRG